MSVEFEKIPDSIPELLIQLKENGVPPEKYNVMIKRYINYKARLSFTPVNGTFELTPLCNLDCKMCYVHLNKEQMNGAQLIDIEVLKALAKEAIDNGMLEASLTGGECLTYPWFDEFYLFLHSYGIEVSVFTNAVLLDEKRIEFFKAHPPKTVFITLYGQNEDVYERVTGHRSFQRVYDNIIKAKEAGIPIKLSVTPNSYLGDDGDELVKLAISLNLPIRINSALFEPREGTNRSVKTSDALLDCYVSMNKIYASSIGYDIDEVEEESLPDLGTANKHKEYGTECGAGRSTFTIDWKGQLHPCNSLYQITSYPLRDGLKKAWSDINRYVDEYQRPVECRECKYKKVCTPCAALHLQAGIKGHCNPDICVRIKRMVKEGLYKL